MVKSKRGSLYIISLLSAAEVIIAYSVLGNISIGDAVVTFAIVPVLAAAMLLGPGGGAFLGLVYGLSGMWKACSFYCEGVEKLFSPIDSGNAVYSVILAIGTRVLFGLVAGIIFRLTEKRIKEKNYRISVSASISMLVYTSVFYGLRLALFGDNILYSEDVLVTLLDFAINLTVAVVVLVLLRTWMDSEHMQSLFETMDQNNALDLLNKKLKFYVTAIISVIVVVACGLISWEFFNKTNAYFDHSTRRFTFYIMTTAQFYIAILMAVFILAVAVRYYAFFTLSESERTMSMINMIPGGVCILEADGTDLSIVFISDGIKDLLGVKRETNLALGSNDPFDYCHPEDVETIKEQLAVFDPKKNDFEVSFRISNRVKGFIWVTFRAYMGQRIGNKLRFYGVILDSDNQIRRKTELEQRYLEGQLSNEVVAIDAVMSFRINLSKNTCDLDICNLDEDVPWTEDIDTVDMLFKRASERNTGMDSMLGYKKLFDRKKMMEEFGVGKSSFKYEHNFLVTDTSVRWVESRASLYINPDNNDIEGYLSIRDIDDQKNTKIINERILAGVFEYVELINIEDDSVKIFMTKYPERFGTNMEGLTYTRILEHHMYKVVSNVDVDEIRRRLSLATITRELERKSIYTCAFTITDKGIDSRKMFQFQYLDRFHKRIIFTQSDITDVYTEGKYKDDILKDAVKETEMVRAEHADFVSRVSRDIRTPLNDILGLSHIAMQDDNIERVREYLGKINMLGEVLRSIADDIAETDKGDNKRMYSELHFGPCSLSSCLAGVIVMFNPQMEEKNQLFIYNPGSFMDIPLSMDKSKVRQVLGILMSNAIKFTPNDGKIWMTIEQKVNKEHDNAIFTRFMIKDNGVGMTDEFLTRAFEPFAVESSGGAGIGLSVAKRLVDTMEGKIYLHSQKNVGTEAVVELEFKEAHYEPLAEDESDASFDLTGRKILLVEDNIINSEMAVILLEQAGLMVDVAENGLRAVERFLDMPSRPRYDAILMDIQMPVMDGIKATQSIRALGADYTDRVPIIAMTANAFSADIDEAMEAGMNAYITKPINPKELFKLLDEHIKKSGIVVED
ncbi:MAG: response regulator [Lachnospiraceae bacterium]|nr:response regulator [Lachnospiraceae bacterium]